MASPILTRRRHGFRMAGSIFPARGSRLPPSGRGRADGAESVAGGSAARGLFQHRPEHQRGPAVHAVGGRAAQAADGLELEGESRRELPAPRVHAARHAFAAAQGRPECERHGHHVRGECRPAQHLYGRPRAAVKRSAAVVVWLLGRHAMATRSWSRRSACGTMAGSTSTAHPLRAARSHRTVPPPTYRWKSTSP